MASTGIVENYKFTNKKHTLVSIMSCILGAMADLSILAATFLPYFTKAESVTRFGLVCVLSGVYGLAGIVLAIIGLCQKESYSFFPKLGLTLNILVFVLAGVIIIMGI